MTPRHLLLVIIVATVLVGCDSSAPRDTSNDERTMSEIVALLAGYESGGVVSMLGDLIDDSLMAIDGSERVVLHASQPGVPSIVRSLVRNRRGSGVLGESRTRVTIRPATVEAKGRRRAVAVSIDGRSLHAGATMAIRAANSGGLVIVREPGSDAYRSDGELRVDGSLGDRSASGGELSRVEVTFDWSGLRVARAIGDDVLPRVTGTIAVSVSASGERGIVQRNGILTFDGSPHAVLAVAGNRRVIDVRNALVLD